MDQLSFIDHWEVEIYRRKVSVSDRQVRSEREIALVTEQRRVSGTELARGLFNENDHVL
jgi:hypothetical protein